MSDPFTDAYRPEWKPKGFGWWPKNEQKKHLQKCFDQGLRDQDFIFEMVNKDLLTPSQARDILAL